MLFEFKKEIPQEVDPFYSNKDYVDSVFMYEFHDNHISRTMLEGKIPVKSDNGGYHYFIYAVPSEKYNENLTEEDYVEYGSIAVLSSPFHYIKHLDSVGYSGKIVMLTQDFLDENNHTVEELYECMNSDEEE